MISVGDANLTNIFKSEAFLIFFYLFYEDSFLISEAISKFMI